MDELVYWIWLSLACTPDTRTFSNLIQNYDSAKDIYNSEEKDLSRIVGYRNSDRSALLNKDLDRAKEIYTFCKRRNVGVLIYSDEKYPSSLREISTPPVLLYYRGHLPDFNKNCMISAVGTRSLSDYGRKSAFRISYDLASAGAVIVSGMALGIDGVSLAGALSAGGSTVAVIGSGIDVCYPMQHQRLAQEIVKRGCVFTEYPPGTPPNKYNFPKRNRIISGLSSATIVFEGREKSGALITARYAKDQGRAVYALPGNVGSPGSEVCNLLLKNGAKPCTCAEDVINDFSETYRGMINPFALKLKCPVDVMSALSALSVVAICQGDDVFSAPIRRQRRERIVAQNLEKSNDISAENNRGSSECLQNLDAESLRIYKKIPPTGECSLESLIDEQLTLRDVMKCLLKLEMGRFIVMLPGEMVARKSK